MNNIIIFKLTDENTVMNFSKLGNYHLIFIGGFSVKNDGKFEVEICNKITSEKVQINIPKIKRKELIGNKRAIIYANFEIRNVGNYKVNMKNINDLKFKKSMLFLREFIFPSIISNKNIEVKIQKDKQTKMKTFKIICILLFFNVNSFGQNSFNWYDTSFQINSKKIIKLSYDLESYCSMNPCYDFGTNNLVYDTIIKFLKENSTLKIEIGVHEDSKASDLYCKERSERVAEYIKNILVENAINPDKLIPIGYGNTKRIIPESEIILQEKMKQEYSRRTNSRIEITILKK